MPFLVPYMQGEPKLFKFFWHWNTSTYICFVHSIFRYFGFWYFGQLTCVIFFPVFSLQNVNKDYVTFLHFCNFVAKSAQKQKKQKWDKRKIWYKDNVEMVYENWKRNLIRVVLIFGIKITGTGITTAAFFLTWDQFSCLWTSAPTLIAACKVSWSRQ